MTERKDVDRFDAGSKEGLALDRFFEAARAEAPLPRDDFMARLTAEALAEMPVAGARVADDAPGFWAQLSGALGGWGGLSGLVAACAVGIWVGVNPPTGLADEFETYRGGDGTALGEMGVDPLSGFDVALLEG